MGAVVFVSVDVMCHPMAIARLKFGRSGDRAILSDKQANLPQEYYRRQLFELLAVQSAHR